jgi:hypothetical protein
MENSIRLGVSNSGPEISEIETYSDSRNRKFPGRKFQSSRPGILVFHLK